MKINSTLKERLHEKGYTTYSNEIFRKYYTDDIHQIIRVEDNEIFDYWIKYFNGIRSNQEIKDISEAYKNLLIDIEDLKNVKRL